MNKTDLSDEAFRDWWVNDMRLEKYKLTGCGVPEMTWREAVRRAEAILATEKWENDLLISKMKEYLERERRKYFDAGWDLGPDLRRNRKEAFEAFHAQEQEKRRREIEEASKQS